MLLIPILVWIHCCLFVMAFLPTGYYPTSRSGRWIRLQESSSTDTTSHSLEVLVQQFVKTFDPCKTDVTKTCKVKIAPVATDRLGLVATQSIQKGDVMLAMPYDERYELTANLALNTVFKGILPENYDGWTGDMGLIALLILNEIAKLENAGVSLPKRDTKLQSWMQGWVEILPSPKTMNHPLLWPEEDQEILQSSSTNKIYRIMDDLEEDMQWLNENVFQKDRARFPENVKRNGESLPCFTVEGFKWALALAQSRSFFLDGRLRLIPFLDMCNHDDYAEEITAGTMGAFGTTKGAQLIATENYKEGDEVFCSYGPKSAADYVLEHGFCPDQCLKTAVSELTFEVDPEDRFYDDKMDILEFETYDQAPMDPVQTFDVVSAPDRDGQPDPAMIQFVRLCKLGGQDAFLLESIFRKEVWGFMEEPVSEGNELNVVNTISEACKKALDEIMSCPKGGPPVCAKIREAETKALTRTLEYLQRDKEALDLKEYYQERRLKALGLDSEWTPEEEDFSEDLGFGQTRAPGGADYDW